MRRAIAAMDEKRGIATDSGIPWDVAEDRAYFRETTAASTVLMGSATYEELAEPLPGRRNLVASRTASALRDGFEIVHDVPGLLCGAAGGGDDGAGTLWVIGGAGLYTATLQWMDELYLTQIPGDYGCTKFFPAFDDAFSQQRSVAAKDAPGVRFEMWTRRVP